MIQIQNNRVFSDSDKYIHRLGTEQYFKRVTTLKGDMIIDSEEVDEILKQEENNIPAQGQILSFARMMVRTNTSIPSKTALKIPDVFPNFTQLIGE